MTEENLQETQQLSSDKMRNKPVGKLLFEMALPAIISMLVQALYNIVDSIFVSNITYSIFSPDYIGTVKQLGDDSFIAVSVVFPMTMLVISIAIGLGVGVNAYIARKLGEGNVEKANRAAQTAIVMVFGVWVLLFILAFTIVDPFVRAFVTADNVTSVDYVVEQANLYLTMYMAGSLGSLFEIVGERILQATGNMKLPMMSQLTGAVTNIILDAVFILVFKWGVFGAILATVIGQWFGGLFVLLAFVLKKHDVSISLKGFRFEWDYFKNILEVGMPAFIMNAMGSFITIILNIILKAYPSGIFVLSAYFKVQSFIFMPVFGLMQGSMPILSYNYGANLKDRFKHTFRLMIYVSVAVMVVGTILFQLIPNYIMGILTSTEQTIADGSYAFRVISLSFIPAAFSIVIINVLQAINKPISSLLMSLCRQLIILLPAAFILNGLRGLQGIWFCYPVAEILSVLAFIPVAIKDYRKQFARKQLQYESGELGK